MTDMAADDDTAIRLVEEALHLRMYGERAPGGNETWREWDRKAEAFLRARLPEAITRRGYYDGVIMCRVCNDTGWVWSPDPDGMSVYESACPEPVHNLDAGHLRDPEGDEAAHG